MSTPAAESTHTVGPYQLIGQIGEGGMGVVYLAIGPDDRRVAVKVLRPSIIGDVHGRDRLAREVTSLRRVRSPRIAEVYGADPWGETPYVVTRYVAGPSLREVVGHRGPLGGDALIRLARGLAEALVAVHRADVLHRDVKPSNVLIEDGAPVLIDFGLAQLADDMTLTQTGWLLGTPGYLAPEILYGDSPTPAADVHAWAATVTYAALGRGPYGGGPPMAIMDRARRGEANLGGVPLEIAAILSAALRPDPANRPTARQLVEWLDSPATRAASTRVAVQPDNEPTMRAAVPARTAQTAAYGDRAAAARAAQTAVYGDRAVADRSSTVAVPAAAAFLPVDDLPTGRLRRGVFWVSMLLLVVAGTVAAPVVTVAWAAVAGWALRTTTLASRSMRAWRAARGPRRRDSTMCTLLLPWFVARMMVASLASAVCVAGCAASFLALARWGPSSVQLVSLVVAGVIVALTAWGGPFTSDVRHGGRLVLANLPRSGLASVILGLLVLGVVSGLLATQQITGTTYLPL